MFESPSVSTVSDYRGATSLIARLPAALLLGPVRLVRMARGRRRADQLAREYEAARVTLGERMYAAGIDDGETGCLIAAIQQRILTARYQGASWEPLEAEREKLFIRLADAALENDAPLPGADDEFARAWALKTAHTRTVV